LPWWRARLSALLLVSYAGAQSMDALEAFRPNTLMPVGSRPRQIAYAIGLQ
jgi:hypothetical protein